jgi:hypothetical protein
MTDLKQFARAVVSHWITLMGGGAIIVAVGIFERRSGKDISWPIYVALICVLLVIASFLAWRDNQREIKGLQQALAKEQDPIRREFEAIRLRLLTTIQATEITKELGNLKALILSRRELLNRKDVGDFFIKWIMPHEIHIQVGAQLSLSQEQYDEMKRDLVNIGDSPGEKLEPK